MLIAALWASAVVSVVVCTVQQRVHAMHYVVCSRVVGVLLLLTLMLGRPCICISSVTAACLARSLFVCVHLGVVV
jgi:hypothetical protein